MSVVTGLGPADIDGRSDAELVALARGGSEPAFEAIVRRYRPPLASYCRRWLDAYRAEEVVQHTMMKAFICLRDDDRPLTLRPWLYRVAHNAALNALDKKGADWEELDENYDGVPQPPQVAEQRARFLKVVGEIEALPARQREALLLNEFEGRCYADIAVELGTSESGVRGLLRRARRQLRETAAAALLPFPALRELIRSDAGRSFHAERAGEIVASAGAAGGVGAAGLAKVAAGVLAAGTIATGGTALEHPQPPFVTPEAEARGLARPAAQEPNAVVAAAAPVVTASGSETKPLAARRIALSGATLLAAAGRPVVRAREMAAIERVKAHVPAEGEPTGAVPLAPVPGASPDVLSGAPTQGEGQQQGGSTGSGGTTGSGGSGGSAGSGGSTGSGGSAGSGGSTGSSTGSSQPAPDQQQPSSAPASSEPVQPLQS